MNRSVSAPMRGSRPLSLVVAAAMAMCTVGAAQASPAAPSQAAAPPRMELETRLVADAGCRFDTFGALARWMSAKVSGTLDTYGNTMQALNHTQTYAEEWGDQWFSCGVSDLPGHLETAFNTMVETGDFSHPLARRATNSAQAMTEQQRSMKSCAQAMGQVEEYRRAMSQIDSSFASHRELGSMLQKGIDENQQWIRENCG